MVTVERAGVDTWSPCWSVDPDSTAGEWLSARATRAAARGTLLGEKIAGHRVGWVRQAGMLYAEGHPTGDGLCPPGDLPGAYERLVGELLAEGVPVPIGRAGVDLYGAAYEGLAGIRRLDATCDLRTGSTLEGRALMGAVAAVARDAPRCKGQAIWAADGSQVETVYFRGYGGARILGRWYDKGTESGGAPPGRWLRPEDQRRFPREHRRAVQELTPDYVRGKFVQRFEPLWRATRGVKVGGLSVVSERLVEAVEAGELTPRAAELLAGYVALRQTGADRLVNKQNRTRRRRGLRELGLVLADGVLEEVEVDLGEALESLLDGGCWGQG